MFDRFFGKGDASATPATTDLAPRPAPAASDPTGDTATVRRIVGKLEAMPPDQARLVASAAYILARAANADLVISDEETTIMEGALQRDDALDEATAVLVVEMAKLQAKTVGGTEDYVVTREFKSLATHDQCLSVLHACFLIGAANGSISAEESAVANEIALELDIDPATLAAMRAEFTDQMSAVQEMRRLASAG
jgi:tellurite resistance protein